MDRGVLGGCSRLVVRPRLLVGGAGGSDVDVAGGEQGDADVDEGVGAERADGPAVVAGGGAGDGVEQFVDAEGAFGGQDGFDDAHAVVADVPGDAPVVAGLLGAFASGVGVGGDDAAVDHGFALAGGAGGGQFDGGGFHPVAEFRRELVGAVGDDGGAGFVDAAVPQRRQGGGEVVDEFQGGGDAVGGAAG